MHTIQVLIAGVFAFMVSLRVIVWHVRSMKRMRDE